MKNSTFILLLIALIFASCAQSSTSDKMPVIDTNIDSDSWSLIPSGEFLMGQHEHSIDIDYDYEMMVTTVTNKQFAEYLNDALAAGNISMDDESIIGYYPGDDYHGYNHEKEIKEGNKPHFQLNGDGSYIMYDGSVFSSIPGYENHPVVTVTWFGARAYCEYYDWRLPTEIEWEKGARGSDNRPFPWGDEITPENANYYSSYDLFEKIATGIGGTTPVGFYNGSVYDDFATEDSPSPYGLYDMAGNVWQWTGDVYKDQHYRYLRGGSRENYAYNLRVWTRNSAGPEYSSPNVGFRCAREN